MYATLADLLDAVNHGGPRPDTLTAVIDNDTITIHTADGEDVFEAHPADLMQQALDALGIPHEPA